MTLLAEAEQQQWESSTDPAWMLTTALERGADRRTILATIIHAVCDLPSDPMLRELRERSAEMGSDYVHGYVGVGWAKEILFGSEPDAKSRLRLLTDVLLGRLGATMSLEEARDRFAETVRRLIPWSDLTAKPAGTPPSGVILGKTHYAWCSESGNHAVATIRPIPADWDSAFRDPPRWRHDYPTQEIAEAYARAKLREMGELPALERGDKLAIHGKTLHVDLWLIGDRWSVETYRGTELVALDTELEALDVACAEIKRLDEAETQELSADELAQIIAAKAKEIRAVMGPTHYRTPTQETTPMSTAPMKETSQQLLRTLQTDATDAAWRTAGAQFVKLARDPLVALLCRHLGPSDESLRGKIASFLETEIGTALLASVLSVGLSAMSARAGEVPQKLARELRVAAMADAGCVVADLLMDPMLKVVTLYLQDPAGTLRVETPTLEEPSNVVGITEAQQKVGMPR